MRTVIFLWIILASLPLEKSVLALTHHATVNGNARGAPCVFPFDLWGTPHHGCSGAYHHSHWCSTTHTYEDDRLWGECPDYDVCDIHKVIDDPWRNVGFTSTFPSWPRTDDALAEGWYRFAGVGGDVLYEGCPSSGAGGTKYPLSLCGGDTHPGPADGVKAMSLCFPDNCQGDEEVNVLACPAGFYLYYLYPTSKSYVTRHRLCNVTVCGVNARCEDGSGGCVCSSGYEIPAGTLPTGDSYGCADIDECGRDSSLCGPNALCSNTNGSFSCVCNKGYQKPPGVTITNATNPCQDVDECSERPDVCGADGSASCSNTMGSFYCTCNEGYISCKAWNASSPEICKAAADMVDEIFDQVHQGQVLHADGLFRSAESLIAQLVQPTVHHHVTDITTNSTEVQIVSVGPNVSGISHLTTTDVTLDIDLHGIAKHYNGSAYVALVVYNNMEEVLNASFFHSEDHTVKNTMMSKVVSVISPRTLNNTLPNPVNITLRHLTEAGPEDEPVCVNWRASAWLVESCNASRTNSTHTVCTCEHLSTFALIMQTHDTPKRDPVLELVNTVLVVVGLVFLTLAVLTFALCRFNGRVTNAARLNLCVCLLLAHLLLLLSQRFLHLIRPHKVLCKASAVLQHFLFLCCFLWMSIEALLLFLSVRRLKRVNSHPQAGPHWAFNLLIGYGVPLVIVGVSASVFPDGYGSQQCWLQVDYGFNWSFLGPVCFILTGNMILFIAILINVHFTLKEARSNISKVKYTRLLLFKIMAQFIILGCPWILGMFLSSSRVLEVLFLLLTSQQGTFIFLVHCLLNDEVWRQYARWWSVCVPSRGHLVSTATSSVSLNKIMSMV